MKELAATALIATAAATAPVRYEWARREVLVFALACAAVLDILRVFGIL